MPEKNRAYGRFQGEVLTRLAVLQEASDEVLSVAKEMNEARKVDIRRLEDRMTQHLEAVTKQTVKYEHRISSLEARVSTVFKIAFGAFASAVGALTAFLFGTVKS